MTKKELSKYYYLSIEIKELETQIRELMDSLVGSPALTGMPHGSGIGNPVERKAILMVNLKNKLERRKSKSLNELTKIETYIDSIEKAEVRMIFKKRYIHFKRWEDIAREMCMSESSIFKKHQEQLKNE
ncbi:MAG: DUF1492 domain-containing protein [Firmicutes bacterium]|nr:DUF1492 domain-containing protein [Bacillota bacterium]